MNCFEKINDLVKMFSTLMMLRVVLKFRDIDPLGVPVDMLVGEIRRAEFMFRESINTGDSNEVVSKKAADLAALAFLVLTNYISKGANRESK